MVFKPETLDGQAAAARLLAKKTNEVHACLKEVFAAFPFKKSDTGDYTSARVQWERTPKARRHEGDRGVPAGAIVLFRLKVSTTKDPWPGHIGISLGGNRLVSTDWPVRGKIGIATIEEIEKAWAVNEAEFLGWTDVIGGHNVTVGPDPDDAAPAGSDAYKYEKTVLTYLNLRAAPKTGKVLTVIPAGAVVKTGKTRAGWTPVQYGNKVGFAAAEYMVLRAKTVTKNDLWLRDKPVTVKQGAKAKAKLKKGTKVTVLRVNGDTTAATYWQVLAGKQSGWVHSGYLK